MKAFSKPFADVFFGLLTLAFPIVVLLRSRGLVVVFPLLALGLIASAVKEVGLRESWTAWWDAARKPLQVVWILLFFWMGVQCLWALNPPKTLGTLAGVGLPCLVGALALWALPRLERHIRDRLTRTYLVGGGLVLALLVFEAATGGMLVHAILGRTLGNYAKGFSFWGVLFWPWLGLLFYVMRSRFKSHKPAIMCVVLVGLTGLLALNLTTSAVVVQWGLGVLAFGLIYKWPRLFWVLWAGMVAMLFLEPWIILKTCTLEMQGKYMIYLKGSAQHRVEIWYYLAHLLGQFPWGVGAGGVRFLKEVGIPDPDFIHYVSPTFRHVSSHYGLLSMHPHNLPLQLWMELGMLGTLTFALALMGGIAQAWRRLSPAWTLGRAIFAATLTSAAVPAFISYGAWQGWWIATLWLAALAFSWLGILFDPFKKGVVA